MKRERQYTVSAEGREIILKVSVTAWYPHMNGARDPSPDVAFALKKQGGSILRDAIADWERG